MHTATLDPATQQTLHEIQLQLAGQVGAMLMLTLSFLILVVGVALLSAHSLRARRAGFVLFALDSVVILFVPGLFTMIAAPALLFVSIVGFVRARRLSIGA